MTEFFTRNLGLKLLSLILAISLEVWFVSPQNLVTERFTASVELSGLPPNMVVVSPPGAERGLFAACRVRGPAPLIGELRKSPQKFEIAIPATVSESFIAYLNPTQLRLPSGVEVIDIEPIRFELRFEPITDRELTVEVETAGSPPKGYRIEQITVMPDRVVARGPSSELKGSPTIPTKQLDVSWMTSSQTAEMPLRERGPHTTLSARTVQVQVQIVPTSSEKVGTPKPK